MHAFVPEADHSTDHKAACYSYPQATHQISSVGIRGEMEWTRHAIYLERDLGGWNLIDCSNRPVILSYLQNTIVHQVGLLCQVFQKSPEVEVSAAKTFEITARFANRVWADQDY